MFKTLAGFVMGWMVFTDEGNKLAKGYIRQLKKEWDGMLKEKKDDGQKDL